MTDRLRKAHRFAAVPEHLIRDRSLTDRAFRLWCILDRYAGADDAAFPLRSTLAADLDCSPASLDRAVAELVEGGWLHKERRGQGRSNLYTLLVAKVPSLTRRKSVRNGGVVTGEDSRVVTDDESRVLTGDDLESSPVRTGVLTGDEHKEASPKEASPKEADSLRSSVAKTSTRGTRLPSDWEPDEDLRQWFREQPFAALVQPWAETQKFKDYWIAQPGQRGVKVDWAATWRNWMRKAAENTSGRGAPLQTRHAVPGDDPDRQARVAAFDGQRATTN